MVTTIIKKERRITGGSWISTLRGHRIPKEIRLLSLDEEVLTKEVPAV